MMTESKCEPEQFKGKIILMSMYSDIDWGKRGNTENCMEKTAEGMMLNFAESGHPVFRASSTRYWKTRRE